MAYVFNLFNLVLLVGFAVMALVVLSAYGGVLKDLQEKFDDLPYSKRDTSKHDSDRKRTRRITTACMTILVLGTVVLACNHIPARTHEIETKAAKTAALIKLATAVEHVTNHRLGERCAFNGLIVADNWIETDSFPCVTVWKYRLWSKGAAGGKNQSAAIRREFVIGETAEDDSMVVLAETNLDSLWNGYPYTYTRLTDQSLIELASALDGLSKQLK
jgi:hypothetical protein